MWTLVLTSMATLALIVLAVRKLEPQFAFVPISGETVTPRDFRLAFEAMTIETDDGERLRGWAIAGARPRAYILYFHGNGGNLSLWAPILSSIAAHGYAIMAFDYRGYGFSTGRPTERGLYHDVEAAVKAFWRHPMTGAPVVYWGRSLGVVMASYAATIRKPTGLILESGFPDARSLMRRSPLFWLLAHLSSYRFPAAKFLGRPESAVPTLVLHGDDDHIVPINQGRALFNAIAGPKRFVTLHGGDHNDLTPSDPEIYWAAVREFSESLYE